MDMVSRCFLSEDEVYEEQTVDDRGCHALAKASLKWLWSCPRDIC